MKIMNLKSSQSLPTANIICAISECVIKRLSKSLTVKGQDSEHLLKVVIIYMYVKKKYNNHYEQYVLLLGLYGEIISCS